MTLKLYHQTHLNDLNFCKVSTLTSLDHSSPHVPSHVTPSTSCAHWHHCAVVTGGLRHWGMPGPGSEHSPRPAPDTGSWTAWAAWYALYSAHLTSLGPMSRPTPAPWSPPGSRGWRRHWPHWQWSEDVYYDPILSHTQVFSPVTGQCAWCTDNWAPTPSAQ